MSRTSSDDPRYLRVREQLITAILDLASTRPAESISVAELAAAAGVSRAAFYSHAASPAALLSAALIAEIDPALRASLEEMCLSGADYVGGWRRIYIDLLDHTYQHRAIYRVAMTQESSVCSALTAHFEEITEPCIRKITSHFEGPAPTSLWTHIAVTQQAHNMISVMRAWVIAEFADPPEKVVDTYMSLAPPWQLARADEHGTISMRRTRLLYHPSPVPSRESERLPQSRRG
jgi:AcrR family transcriptional regulator